MSLPGLINITVTHRTAIHTLSLPSTTLLSDLQAQLQSLTGVPVSNQKLLYKRHPAPRFSARESTSQDDSGPTIVEAGLSNRTRVMLVGNTTETLEKVKSVAEQEKRKERILKEREAKGPTKLRSTASSSSSTPNIQYRFHRIEPLSHLPDPASAKAFLTRFATDPAVLHVLHKHRYSIGLLTELGPDQSPNLLGLNTNAGQIISLRIRTPLYDGFRPYSDVRRVLMHELAHCVHGNHDDEFKALMSLHNKEVQEFERARREGTHTLSSGDFYEPDSVDGGPDPAEEHTHVLGGTAPIGGGPITRDERRARILEATMKRLRLEDKDIEEGCGSGRGESV